MSPGTRDTTGCSTRASDRAGGFTSTPASIRGAGHLLGQATVRLRRAGCETPRLDAEVLLAHATGLTRETLLAHPETVPTPEQARAFEDLIGHRQRRCPVAYLVGRREFMSLGFEVTPGVLVPRPETELLVEVAARLARALQESRSDERLVLADVGTGCGVVAVTLSRLLPEARVFAIDVSETALVTAGRNAERLGAATALELRRGDLLEALAGDRPRPLLDGVVANLPYVPDAVWATLPPEVRDYEPPESLRGGSDGLDIYRRLAAELPTYLAPGGFACLEIGPGQGLAASALLAATGLFPGRGPVVHQDLAGRERVVAAAGTGEPD